MNVCVGKFYLDELRALQIIWLGRNLDLQVRRRLVGSGNVFSVTVMNMNLPIGIHDFRELRERGCEYVDKTRLITELLDESGIKVLLLPRPRRFGKTLNLSLLRYFFEKSTENLWPIFEGLHVSCAGEKYRAHFQQYPVIFVSFRGTKANTIEECWLKIKSILQELYATHASACENHLDARQWTYFQSILNGTALKVDYEASLGRLTEFLHIAHGRSPIVLIDEYDAPIHTGFAQGYYTDIVSFFRSFLEIGLKDNAHLERAVLTGILRISRESIFSGLNHIRVLTILDEEFNACFGFTEQEVATLLEKANLSSVLDSVRNYYDGYEFGGLSIYNPWSILHFLHSKTKQLQPYWLNTSTNELVKELLTAHALTVQNDIRVLLSGGSIEKDLNENTAFPELKEDPEGLWSLLVFTGYLKAARGPVIIGAPRPPFNLSIPNLEVDHVYRTTFHSWMNQSLKIYGGTIQALLDALLSARIPDFEAQLQAFAMYCVSFHDLTSRDPERFYQGLMIGLLASLEPAYEVRSNRESGSGRPDVMITPRKPGKPGVILELKAARYKKTLKQALAEGHQQLQANDYGAELRAAGVETIHAMVVAFDGKTVKVEAAKSPTKRATKRVARKTR